MKKSARSFRAGMAALFMLALAGTFELATAAPHGPGSEAGLYRVLGKLNLTAAQKDQVQAIVGDARAQSRSARQAQLADLPALGNPGDPNHAAAVQAAQTRAVERVQRWNEAEQRIYGLLTPAQQQQLPSLLLALQQRMVARHGGGGPPAP